MKIVLIDDDKDLCALTQKVLSAHGHGVNAFYEPKSGMKYAKENVPDVILMDVMLPDLSGPEIVRVLQADPVLKDVPVIFLTALVSGGEKSLENEGIMVGGLKYQTIGKPYEIPRLLDVIARAGRGDWKKR